MCGRVFLENPNHLFITHHLRQNPSEVVWCSSSHTSRASGEANGIMGSLGFLVVIASPFRLPVALRRAVEVCLLLAGLEPFVPRPKNIWADGAYGGKELAK